MAYRQAPQSWNTQGFAGRGFTPAPYNPNYRNQNGNNNYQQPKKHSGCKSGRDKNNNPYVQGWKYDKRNGLRSFLAVPYKGTSEHKSGTGKVWHNWMIKITAEGRKPELCSGLYDPSTGRVIIKDLGYVMNPKGGKGGYVGTYINKG